MWRIKLSVLISAVLLVNSALYAQGARAVMVNGQGDTIGTFELSESDSGVTVSGQVRNISPGAHGLHVHQKGECSRPDFASAGDHFNPTNTSHGFLHPQGPHGGDLPNLEVQHDGTAKYSFTTRLVTMRKNAQNSLLRSGKTSLVLHERGDDYVSQPSGNSGGRIACGVIEEVR